MQPGARPPQGAGQAHRTSVLRNPTITVEPASQQAAPGVTTEIVLAIVNNSDTVSDFTVELDDRRIGWIRIEPATKNLWPGSRDVFRVLVTPPRSAEVRAGLKQYGLTITSSGIPGGVANTSIQVDVLPFEEVEPRLVPKTSAGYFRGRHRIEVRNLGSAPWTARLSASDPEEALRISRAAADQRRARRHGRRRGHGPGEGLEHHRLDAGPSVHASTSTAATGPAAPRGEPQPARRHPGPAVVPLLAAVALVARRRAVGPGRDPARRGATPSAVAAAPVGGRRPVRVDAAERSRRPSRRAEPPRRARNRRRPARAPP